MGRIATLQSMSQRRQVYARSGHQAICANVWVDAANVWVDAVQCPIAVQCGIAERNKGVGGQRVDWRLGINLSDVIVEARTAQRGALVLLCDCTNSRRTAAAPYPVLSPTT
jgi:hypothetical protein